MFPLKSPGKDPVGRQTKSLKTEGLKDLGLLLSRSPTAVEMSVPVCQEGFTDLHLRGDDPSKEVSVVQGSLKTFVPVRKVVDVLSFSSMSNSPSLPGSTGRKVEARKGEVLCGTESFSVRPHTTL